MRILHLDTGKSLRGGQIQALLLIDGLLKSGHHCVLLARENGPLWEAAQHAGISIFPATLPQLSRRSAQSDLVHAHDAHAHTMAAVASRRPFVAARRVAFPVNRSLASKWKYSRPRRFLAVSRFVASELQAAGVRSEKIDVVYDGVEVSRSAEAWDASYPAVALASTDPLKGRSLVESAARAAGIPVVFSSDLQNNLLTASMFVYITQSEGLGSAALVAMAMGVPAIASCVGGLAEVFENEVSGLFVRNEPDEIARTMRRVRENSALAATLIDGGKRRVNQMFTKQQMVEGTLACYARSLAG